MGKLKIRVLGALSIEDEGNRTLSLTRKNKAVLAALALAGPAGLPRQKLAELFWRDRSEKQARASLRQALVVIRKGLGSNQVCLQADPDQIVIDGSMIEVDAHEFDMLASSKSGADKDRALTLYKGDLLDDIRLNEEGFEAWLQPLRERLRAKAIALLGEGLESTRDAAQCVVLASHLLELDPTDEAAHRALMRTYAAQGRDNAALKQFATCRDRLERDLGIGPSRQTIVLYEEIIGKRRRPTVREANGGERKMTDAPTEQPDKASIAVLPFDNLSGDPEQEYFADGISEDIITLLSKQRWLFVIARNSSFTFRGAAIDVRQVGKNLGVRYVLEGSVRKDGNRIRVTAQLIEAESGNHIWAEHYDRELDDIFELQDEITQRISASLKPELERAEWQRLRFDQKKDPNAWDLYLRGLWHSYKHTQNDNRNALEFLHRALDIDEDFSQALATAAYVKFNDVSDGYTDRPKDTLHEAFRLAEKAVASDDQDAYGHFILGRIYSIRFDYEQAISELEFAIKLNPCLADAYHGLGFTLTYSGRAEEAIPLFETAYRLSPHDANVWAFFGIRAVAYIEMQQYDEAIKCAREAVRKRYAKYWAFSHLVSALGHGGTAQEAEKAITELLARKPDFTVTFAKVHLYYYRKPEQLDHYLQGLRKAGLPE